MEVELFFHSLNPKDLNKDRERERERVGGNYRTIMGRRGQEKGLGELIGDIARDVSR